jgi:hypothetical protein
MREQILAQRVQANETPNYICALDEKSDMIFSLIKIAFQTDKHSSVTKNYIKIETTASACAQNNYRQTHNVHWRDDIQGKQSASGSIVRNFFEMYSICHWNMD